MITYSKKQSNGQKAARQRKLHVYEKGKTLTLCSNHELAVGDDVVVDEDVDE
jgi:hypothetical protein